MKKAFIAIVLSLFFLEALLRLVPMPRYASNWLYDPLIGHRGPRSELVYLEGLQQFTQYNSHGFRGEDPTPRNVRPDLFSIFIFGDSITESIQIPFRRSYPKRLEYLLNEKLARDTEVTSWAVSDYGTANEYLLYVSEAAKYQPNLVLLQFLGINDFVNNSFAFAGKNKAMSDFARPYVDPTSEKLGFRFVSPSWKFWREHIRLFAYIDHFSLLRFWKEKRNPPKAEGCALETEVFLDEPSEGWKESFAATQKLASAFQAEATANKSHLLAFYAPSYFEVFDAAWKSGVEPTISRCYKSGYHRENPERRFLQLFQAAGVEAISLKEAFLASPLPPQKLFLPDGHYSSEGQQVVAEALARHIAKSAYSSARQR